VLRSAGNDNIKGKTVIDTCNPIAEAPPDHGVLRFSTGPNESLMENLQKEFSDAHLVKAFNSVGAPQMVNPQYGGGVRPTMFICGNNDAAKKTVTGSSTSLAGRPRTWQVEAARAIEPLCMLWCISGLRRTSGRTQFKLLHK